MNNEGGNAPGAGGGEEIRPTQVREGFDQFLSQVLERTKGAPLDPDEIEHHYRVFMAGAVTVFDLLSVREGEDPASPTMRARAISVMIEVREFIGMVHLKSQQIEQAEQDEWTKPNGGMVH